MSSDDKANAAAAKDRGNAAFSKKTKEGYEEALSAYREAIQLDPQSHVYHSNCCACHIELAQDVWEPIKKVECYANAVLAARECTRLDPTWAKGYVRLATAEFELIAAVTKWEDRKKQDEKWRIKDEERAEQDRKEGRKPFIPERKVDPELDAALKDVVSGTSYTACEENCRKALKLDPANVTLRTRLQAMRDAGHTTNDEEDRKLVDEKSAAEFKAKGNASFSQKQWKEAANFYTQALEQNPFDHVFYSNRSACNAELEEFDKALKDADRCVALNPQFAKGYSRQAHALYHVGRYADMENAARTGLSIDPSSKPLEELCKQAETETKEPLAVQEMMHKLREEKRQDAKLKDLMRSLNMQGQNVQMFGPGAGGDLSGLLSGLGGGGGGFGGGGGKANMTEDQMRGMARAMAQTSSSTAGYTAAPTTSTDAVSGAPAGPTAFAPK